MPVEKSVYEGEKALTLPSMDASKFEKQLVASLKALPKASIDITSEFEQNARAYTTSSQPHWQKAQQKALTARQQPQEGRNKKASDDKRRKASRKADSKSYDCKADDVDNAVDDPNEESPPTTDKKKKNKPIDGRSAPHKQLSTGLYPWCKPPRIPYPWLKFPWMTQRRNSPPLLDSLPRSH